ncbi:hypothetical protein JM79_3203 [Gramella sp. Hel_I_59]|uniref:hypothetical protein n=1 Tax=Gramella sp. Hel_I_59 TaxID=1249978 RepID=UPI00114FE900|nr:hypothetical protein [Gramella sp. Hel_I_59]TQI72246.1 hypothetical protein JM79_3203 [Gramella sp. Hel_I_59]
MQPSSSHENSIANLLQQNLEHLKPVPQEIPQKKVYRYPYIDKESIRDTIQNGKKAARDYNKRQQEKSKGINKINLELRRALKQDKHTTQQKALWIDFKQKHKLASKEPMAYNQKVLEFNRANGTHFLLRTYHQLKNEMLVTLPVLICFYAAQVKAMNAKKLNAGVTTMGTLPRLLTNSENIKRYKVEGVQQINFQNDAILAHVHNLVEAGILINYKSHGRNMGFSVDFNPEILAIKDHNPSKTQNPEKQPFIKFKTGKPTYSDDTTGSYKDKNENKGDAHGSPGERNDSQKGESTAATGTHRVTKSEEKPGGIASAESEKRGLSKISEKEILCAEKQDQDRVASSAGLCPPNPPRPEQNKPGGRGSTGSPQAPKNCSTEPVEVHPSKNLENRIQDTWELCLELEANKHVHHIPPMKELEHESGNGILSQPVFAELLYQEFMKVISRLKKKNQSAAGAFYRGFEELEDQKLKNFTGRYYTKTEMYREFKKWMWMINCAERWAKKRKWQFLYINDYLDTQRRDAKEVGFWYLEKAWKKNEQDKAKRKERRAEKRAAHTSRKAGIKTDRVEKYGYKSIKPGTNSRSLSDYEKVRAKVRKYLSGEIDFQELERYCSHNLNQTIVEGLGNLIDAERANLNRFKA